MKNKGLNLLISLALLMTALLALTVTAGACYWEGSFKHHTWNNGNSYYSHTEESVPVHSLKCDCGEYYSDYDTPCDKNGLSSNRNGTHSVTCSVCGHVWETVDCTASTQANCQNNARCACGYEIPNTATPDVHSLLVVYDWAEDGSSCTATEQCRNCLKTGKTATVTLGNGIVVSDPEWVKPTCTHCGYAEYLAVFSGDAEWAYRDELTVAVKTPALGHSFTRYVRDEGGVTMTAHCDREGCEETHTMSTAFILPEAYPEEAEEKAEDAQSETPAQDEASAQAEAETVTAPRTGEGGMAAWALAMLALCVGLMARKRARG